MKLNRSVWLLGVLAVVLPSCSKSLEKDLLEPRAYFEATYVPLEVREETSISYPISARISNPLDSDVELTYHFGDLNDVNRYNEKNGTNYELFPLEDAKIATPTVSVSNGQVFANSTNVTVENLGSVEAGKTYLIPILFTSSSAAEPIPSSKTMFLALSKPIQIKKVGTFNHSGTWVSYPRMPDVEFNSVTYEALVYNSRFSGNATIMGREGTLIFRIGDVGGNLPKDRLQIAGNKQFHYDTPLQESTWYHLAFTFDASSGKAHIYVNGEPVGEGEWDGIGNLSEGMHIGRVPHFMWGERPLIGYMSEVRLWNVARTREQLKQNMLSVDPSSTGLVAYYKLNGEDLYQTEEGSWRVKDLSPNGLDGIPNDGNSALPVKELDTPLELKDLK